MTEPTHPPDQVATVTGDSLLDPTQLVPELPSEVTLKVLKRPCILSITAFTVTLAYGSALMITREVKHQNIPAAVHEVFTEAARLWDLTER